MLLSAGAVISKSYQCLESDMISKSYQCLESDMISKSYQCLESDIQVISVALTKWPAWKKYHSYSTSYANRVHSADGR